MTICRRLFQYVLLVCLILFCGCKSKKEDTGPKLAIDQPEQYCRMAFPGDAHTFKFKLANEGDGVLKILDIKKSCGCVSLGLPVKEIHPGKSVILSLKVSQDRYGLASQWVLLTTNEHADQALRKLVVSTEITPKIVCNPIRITEELYPGERKQRIIKIARHIDTKIESIEKSADWITSLTHKVGNADEIIIAMSAESLQKGEYNDSITIHTSSEELNQITIPIHLRVKSEVSLIPDFLFLGAIRQNQKPKPRFVKVSVCGKSPKKMVVTIKPSALLSYTVTEESNGARIYVDLLDPHFKGQINGEIKIQIEGFDDEMKIPITGYVL